MSASVPVEAGFYLDRNGDLWRLTVTDIGQYWHVVDSDIRYLEEKPIAEYGPFTRLVPESTRSRGQESPRSGEDERRDSADRS